MIGCLMQLLTRNMALGLSLTGIIVSPAFGYAGVGFPVLAMGWFPRAWGAILPLRWYIQILFDQASRGAPLRYTAEPFAILCGLTIVLPLLVWLRFRALARAGCRTRARTNGAAIARRSASLARSRPSGAACSAIAACSSLFVLAPVLYAFSIRSPISARSCATFPIAVVDQDNSELGRGLGPGTGAHGNLSIALRAASYREAEDAILARRAFAILGIPAGYREQRPEGRQARLPIYADSTYFILFNRALQGILESVQAMRWMTPHAGRAPEGAGVQAACDCVNSAGRIGHGAAVQPDASYSSYVVPAAFVLILHQTLLMGAAMLGGVAFEQGGAAGRRARASAAAILGQGLAHWTIYVPAMLLYFVIMPRVYGFSTLGSVWAARHALHSRSSSRRASSGRRLAWSSAIARPRCCSCLRAACRSSSWLGSPGQPRRSRRVCGSARELLPSVNAIDGIVRINQMGGEPGGGVRPDWETLWALTLLYFATAVACAQLRAVRTSAAMRRPFRRAPDCWRAGGGAGRAWRLVRGMLWAPAMQPRRRASSERRRSDRPRDQRPPGAGAGRARADGAARRRSLAVLDNPELWAAVGVARAQVDRARSDARPGLCRRPRGTGAGPPPRDPEGAGGACPAVQELGRVSLSLAATIGCLRRKTLDKRTAEEARRPLPTSPSPRPAMPKPRDGPTAEERALADAQLLAARKPRATSSRPVRPRCCCARLPRERSPLVVPEVGEAVMPGETVLTLVPDGGVWFGFNVREDALGDLPIGARVPLKRRTPRPPAC